ncbi:MAG: FkbM family methyltransferase [Pseudomonadota bacterium]
MLQQEILYLQKATNQSVSKIRIVDIGAGVYHSKRRYQPLLDQAVAHVIGFEPNEDELGRMVSNKKDQFRFFPYAIGDGKKAYFNLTGLPQCSSLYEPNQELVNLFSGLRPRPGKIGAFGVRKRFPVDTRRLDDVPECSNSDYIKIDVQGAELDVLRGAINTLTDALVLEVEVEFVPLYKNQPLFSDIDCFLRDNNFLFHKLLDIQGRPIHPFLFDSKGLKTYSQVLWADAVFIRDSLLLEPSTVRAENLLKASLILNDVYQSYDLVYHLLSAFDRHSDTKTAIDYLNSLKQMRILKRSYMNLIDDLSDLEGR